MPGVRTPERGIRLVVLQGWHVNFHGPTVKDRGSEMSLGPFGPWFPLSETYSPLAKTPAVNRENDEMPGP
jgi:hypothetical protein